MKESHRLRLLEVDAILNLVLGIALLLVPRQTIDFFGLPPADTVFYVTVLGAVLLGIGIALWIERRNDDDWRGLGLAGAIAINVLGGGAVLVWLVIDPFVIPTRGYVVLWLVVLAVVGTAVVEVFALTLRLNRQRRRKSPG